MRIRKTFYSCVGFLGETTAEVKDISQFIVSGINGIDYIEDTDSSNNVRLDCVRILMGKSITLSGGSTGIRVQPVTTSGVSSGSIVTIPKNKTKVFTGTSTVQKISLLEILAPLGSDGIDHFNIKSHIISGVYTQPTPKTIQTTSSVVFKPLDDIKIIKDVYWYQPPSPMDSATQAIPEEIISIPKGVETTITHTYQSPVPGQITFSFMHLKMVGVVDSGVLTVDNPVTPFDVNPHPDNPSSDPNTVPSSPTPTPTPTPVTDEPPVAPKAKVQFFSQDTKEILDKTVKGVIIGSSILLGIWAISGVLPKLTDSVSYAIVRERQLQR